MTNFLEFLAQNKLEEAMETLENAGWLCKNIVLPIAAYLANNPWAIVAACFGLPILSRVLISLIKNWKSKSYFL